MSFERQYSFREHAPLSSELYSTRELFISPDFESRAKEDRIHEIRRKYESPYTNKQVLTSMNSNRSHRSRNTQRDQRMKEKANNFVDSPIKAKIFSSEQNPQKVKENVNPSFQEEELIKRLFQIKQSFSGVPNWEKHAKHILFDQTSGIQTPKYGYQNNFQLKNKELQTKSFNKLSTKDIWENKDLGKRKVTEKPHFQKRIPQNERVFSQLNDYNKVKPRSKDRNYEIQIKQANSIMKMSQEKSEKDFDIQSFKIEERKSSSNRHKKEDSQKKNVSAVDEKINKIQNKIKEFEEKKKKLNIEYVPFKKNSNHSYSISDFDKKISNCYDKTPKKSAMKLDSKHKNSSAKPPKYEARSKNKEKESPKFTKKVKFQTSQSSQVINTFETDVNDFKPIYSQQMAVNTRGYDKYQKQKFNFEKNSISEEKKKAFFYDLVDSLNEQTKLDESFRNDKFWLQICRKENKYDKIQERLASYGVKMSLEEIQREFKVTQDENNPFFSIKQNDSNLDQVVETYLKCQKHWKSRLYRKFDRKKLQENSFDLKTIDLERKGYIILEDLVRFMNLQTGTFFRNRDLALIFRRLCSGERLKFEELLQVICG